MSYIGIQHKYIILHLCLEELSSICTKGVLQGKNRRWKHVPFSRLLLGCITAHLHKVELQFVLLRLTERSLPTDARCTGWCSRLPALHLHRLLTPSLCPRLLAQSTTQTNIWNIFELTYNLFIFLQWWRNKQQVKLSPLPCKYRLYFLPHLCPLQMQLSLSVSCGGCNYIDISLIQTSVVSPHSWAGTYRSNLSRNGE